MQKRVKIETQRQILWQILGTILIITIYVTILYPMSYRLLRNPDFSHSDVFISIALYGLLLTFVFLPFFVGLFNENGVLIAILIYLVLVPSIFFAARKVYKIKVVEKWKEEKEYRKKYIKELEAKMNEYKNKYLRPFLAGAFDCLRVDIIYVSDPNITGPIKKAFEKVGWSFHYREVSEDEAKVVLNYLKENLNMTLGKVKECVKNDTMGFCTKWRQVYQVVFRCYRDESERRYYYAEYYPNFTIKIWLELRKREVSENGSTK